MTSVLSSFNFKNLEFIQISAVHNSTRDSRSDVHLEGFQLDVRLNVGVICIEVGHQVALAYDLGNWCCIDGEQLSPVDGTLGDMQ